MGMRAVFGSPFKARHSSRPDISGIITSRMASAGASFRARPSAARPSAATAKPSVAAARCNNCNNDVQPHSHDDNAIATSRPVGTVARGVNPNGAAYETMAKQWW